MKFRKPAAPLPLFAPGRRTEAAIRRARQRPVKRITKPAYPGGPHLTLLYTPPGTPELWQWPLDAWRDILAMCGAQFVTEGK